MPKGPGGEKRPADVISNAVAVTRIATGEMVDVGYRQQNKRQGGIKGGVARAEKLSAKQRSRIARKAANTRWGK